MRSTSTGAIPFEVASPTVRLTYLEETGSEAWARAGALLAQRYELEAPDTARGPGNLWQARQLRSRCPVTVQLLDAAIVEDAVLMEAFLHEASLSAAIEHPHVARVLDYGIDYELEGGIPFLVLEQLTGETLERVLARQRRLSLGELRQVLSQAGLGLDALHERGLVHRRLDPSHLLLSEDFPSGRYQAGAFSAIASGSLDEVERLELEGGYAARLLFAIDAAFRENLSLVHQLSHQLSSTSAALRGSFAAAGSRQEPERGERLRREAGEYQSPEQLLGHGPVDARSDLWSLAVIAFEALTGTTAFSGATLGERLVRICSGEPNRPPAELALPPGFEDWFRQGVSKLPGDRFASGREMSEAFARLLAR